MALFSEEGIRFFRRLGKVSLVVFVLAALATGLFWGVVRLRERRAEEAWSALDLPGSRPSVRFGDSLTNATAVDLREHMAPLGLDPYSVTTLEELQGRSPWGQVFAEVHRYLEEQLEEPTPAITPPAPILSEFLRAHRPDLAALETILRADLPPRWALEIEDPWRNQRVHFLALTGLGEWLLADALESVLEGHPERATGDLEAAWVLVELLLDRPEVNAQGSALSLARGVTGTLRKVEGAPSAWGERLHHERFRTGLEASIVLWGEGYLGAAQRVARQPYFGRGARRERMFWKIWGRLWFRYSMADASLRIARELEALRTLGDCDGGHREQTRALAGSGSRLGATGRIGLPDYGIQWTSLMHLRAEMELTRKVLELKSRRGSDGAWPAPAYGVGAPECPKARWAYSVDERGAMTLALDGGVPSRRRRGALDLPTTFRAPGPQRDLAPPRR